ncbi:DDE_3 domain-containing protein [Trichonephila clavipes]|nr:DDE_3 domain-containing protein [Trichonephila clavipes]
MNPACQVGTVQEPSGSIMAWGSFFVALFISCKCTNVSQCNSVPRVGDYLLPFMHVIYLHSNGVFQQGNCTSHKSRLATDWLDELSSDFSVINWPPRSPDLKILLSIFGMFCNKAWKVITQDELTLLNYGQL